MGEYLLYRSGLFRLPEASLDSRMFKKSFFTAQVACLLHHKLSMALAVKVPKF